MHRLEVCGVVTKLDRERLKFERERYCVEQLAHLMRLPVIGYSNPLADYAREIGVDVIAVVGERRIGFQVTEYDGGEGNSRTKGRMRAAEMKQVREAPKTGGVYTGWGSPHVEQALPARIKAKVRTSKNHNFTECDEVWLLVSASIPGVGNSTFIPHDHINSDLLNRWTADTLAISKYGKAFLHVIWYDALFEWDRLSGWRNLV
jgi:hypothetical protein